jgi:hypothetical protein
VPGRSRCTQALVAALLATAGCTSANESAPPPPPSSATSTTAPTATVTPSPSRRPSRPPPRMIRNPLTGRLGVPSGPVIAVKIDNTGPARPQVGLESADVVYVEQVEGGQTRLVAVFASRRPRRVEPVRSVRNSDPELLAGYGRVALAYSGGAGGPLATLHRSGLIGASPARAGVAYHRDGGRRAPYNLVVDLPRLASVLPRVTARVRDVGFRWNAGTDGRLARARRVTRLTAVIGTTAVSFRWDRRGHRWMQTAPDGSVRRSASGAALGAPNVILQFCRVTVDRGNVDVNGAPSAYTHSIGSGRAVLLRDGRAVVGRWARPTRWSPTRFLDGHGKELLLRPGGVWVLLVPAGGRWAAR